MPQIVRKFILKLAPPDRVPARPVPERVARLDHKLGNNAVEDHALKVAAPRMTDKVLHGLGRLLREQAHVDVAECRVHCRRVGERRWAIGCNGSSRRDILFLTCGTLVEYISFAFLVVTIQGCRYEQKNQRQDTYGSERVKM